MPTTATEQRFGIFSDEMQGIAEDTPAIRMSQAFLTNESQNVYLRYNEVRRMPGRLKEFLDASNDKVKTPDANPVIHYHHHFDRSETEYEFAYTKAHVYRWRPSTYDFQTMLTCAFDCEMWDSVSVNGKVISTNNVDKVQVWVDSTPATAFVALDGVNGLDLDGGSTYLTKAKYLGVHETYVLLGFTTEGGTVYPYRVRWSDAGDETGWQSTGGSGDAGAKDFNESTGLMKGFGYYKAYGADLLVAFKTDKAHFMYIVESSTVFGTAEIDDAGGLLATHSVVNDPDGNLYYIGTDFTIKQLKAGTVSYRIDKALKAINPDLVDEIEATYLKELNHLCWSVPGAGSSTGNDKLIRLNLTEKSWEFDTFAVRAFGRFHRQSTLTIDGLDALAATIDGLDAAMATIDSVEHIRGFPLILASDYSGYTYDLCMADTDAGNAYTSRAVFTTDLTKKRSLYMFKRCWNILLLFTRKTAGSVNVFAKADNAKSYESLGSVSLVDSAEPDVVRVDLPVDLRARNLGLKIESTDEFDLLGMVFAFDFDGER